MRQSLPRARIAGSCFQIAAKATATRASHPHRQHLEEAALYNLILNLPVRQRVSKDDDGLRKDGFSPARSKRQHRHIRSVDKAIRNPETPG
jgi:hypothetical protein